jgi:hypothetical protein
MYGYPSLQDTDNIDIEDIDMMDDMTTEVDVVEKSMGAWC